MKTFLAIIVACSLMISFAGCKKEEKQPTLPQGHPRIQGGVPPTMPEMPKKERAVVVSPETKTRWSAVRLRIEDRVAKTSKDYTVNIGSSFMVPNTKIMLKVLAFLPDFRMDENQITTASEMPNNPAALVVIQAPEQNEWKGWLYSKHPTIHPFVHEKIGITLVGGMPRQ